MPETWTPWGTLKGNFSRGGLKRTSEGVLRPHTDHPSSGKARDKSATVHPNSGLTNEKGNFVSPDSSQITRLLFVETAVTTSSQLTYPTRLRFSSSGLYATDITDYSITRALYLSHDDFQLHNTLEGEFGCLALPLELLLHNGDKFLDILQESHRVVHRREMSALFPSLVSSMLPCRASEETCLLMLPEKH